jgi:hypothetical protein
LHQQFQNPANNSLSTVAVNLDPRFRFGACLGDDDFITDIFTKSAEPELMRSGSFGKSLATGTLESCPDDLPGIHPDDGNGGDGS